MKLLAIVLVASSSLLCRGATLVFRDVAKRAQPQGIDVSHFQATVNWATVKANGVSFVYIKATEGTSTFGPNIDCSLSNSVLLNSV